MFYYSIFYSIYFLFYLFSIARKYLFFSAALHYLYIQKDSKPSSEHSLKGLKQKTAQQ